MDRRGPEKNVRMDLQGLCCIKDQRRKRDEEDTPGVCPT